MSNQLSLEKSPYLLQHRENPVWWKSWSPEVLALAKEAEKPIFLSIGYSTCHWCHVMERECFEDLEVANFLNAHFVSIKVDREERPDLDEIYMAAVLRLNGHGGWPLSAFLTPEGEPFFGGTYYPKAQFLGLLQKIQTVWAEKREAIEEDAKKLSALICDPKDLSEKERDFRPPSETVLVHFMKTMEGSFDPYYGGFGHAPKFPPFMGLMALLRIARRLDHEKEKEEVTGLIQRTIQGIARGGITDHVGGGISRYSTDEKWLVPHFEKMLYDNALYIRVVSELFQVVRSDEYRQILKETVTYVLRDLGSPEGGFYSAEDADSDNPQSRKKEEGYFYTFSYEELKEGLTEEELDFLKSHFEVSSFGNFEGRNLLNLIHEETLELKWKEPARSILSKLFQIRERHPRPFLDDKVLTGWNGLMIASLAKVSSVLEWEEPYRAAVGAMEFLLSHLLKENGALWSRYRDAESCFEGTAFDYAAVVDALMELYQCDFNEKWLQFAKKIQAEMDTRFWDENSAGYFHTDGEDATLISRLKGDFEGVIPTANSLASYNLLRLASLTGEPKHRERAAGIFSIYRKRLERSPEALPFMILSLDYFLDRSKEIHFCGDWSSPKGKSFERKLREEFLPNGVFIKSPSSKKEDLEPSVQICETGSCQLPMQELESILEVLRKPLYLGKS